MPITEINQIFSEETIKFMQLYGIKWQAEISSWLRKKQALNIKLQNYFKKAKKVEQEIGRINSKGVSLDLSSKNLRALHNQYAKSRHYVEDLNNLEEITKFYREGYKLVHKIREDITGQEIVYSVLYKQRTKIMEAHLSLDQILSASKVNYNDIKTVNPSTDLTNAISLSVTSGSVKKYLREALKEREEELEGAINEIDHPKLWDRLAEIRGNLNYGRLYEVYSILRKDSRYEKINYIGKDQYELYNEIRSNVLKDKIPGWQAGDIGTDQLKTVFSRADLADISSIETVLKEVLAAIQQTSLNEVKTSLTNIFTVPENQLRNTIDIVANKEAIDHIDKMLRNLK